MSPLFGGGSIQLARVFGIRFGVDFSWFIVLFLIIWSLTGYYERLFPGEDTAAFVLAVVSAVLFFLSVLLHELGHALVARREGIGILGIDLWLFGGVAKLDRDTRSAGEEFRVAAAGPLVTLLIAAACFGAAAAIAGVSDAARSAFFDEDTGDKALAVLGYLTLINVLLLVFNLIPGFPLDGGRIARAAAWRVTGDRTRATRFAATLGRGFSYLLVAAGFLVWFQFGAPFTGIWFVVIGFFLGSAARGAERQTAISSRLDGLVVADVMDDDPVAVPAHLDLARTQDEFFLRYGYPWFPVVDEAGRFAGLVTQEAVSGVPEPERPGRTVDSVMARDGGEGSLRIEAGEPLEALLGREGLTRLGAVIAVDGDGTLRGIVTADRVRRALQATG